MGASWTGPVDEDVCEDHRPFIVTFSRPWWRCWRPVFWTHCTSCETPDGPFMDCTEAAAHVRAFADRRWRVLFDLAAETARETDRKVAERATAQPRETGTGWPG